MDDFLGIIRVTELFALLLALLIAFNSTSINADERARENATMMAFGIRAREAVGLSMVEDTIIGLLGTLAGIAIGVGILNYVLNVTLPETLPDLGVLPTIGLGTIAKAVGMGVVAVATGARAHGAPGPPDGRPLDVAGGRVSPGRSF